MCRRTYHPANNNLSSYGSHFPTLGIQNHCPNPSAFQHISPRYTSDFPLALRMTLCPRLCMGASKDLNASVSIYSEPAGFLKAAFSLLACLRLLPLIRKRLPAFPLLSELPPPSACPETDVWRTGSLGGLSTPLALEELGAGGFGSCPFLIFSTGCPKSDVWRTGSLGGFSTPSALEELGAGVFGSCRAETASLTTTTPSHADLSVPCLPTSSLLPGLLYLVDERDADDRRLPRGIRPRNTIHFG